MIRPFSITEEKWQHLLAPLSKNDPCGLYLVYEETYDQIQEARIEEDANLPQGIWKRDIKRADWIKVENLCLQALCEKTKDLQIASWLMEAWTILYGIKGFLKGLTLIEAYCTHFWDTIHPRIQQEDLEFRMAPFEWIDQKFSERLSQLPLTFNDTKTENYTYIDWQKVNFRHELMSSQDKKGAPLGVTMAQFKDACDRTSIDFYEELTQDLQKTLDISISIEAYIYQKHQELSSYLTYLKSQINTVLTTCKIILKEKKGYIPITNPETIDTTSSDIIAPQDKKSLTFTSREEAYRRLGEIADFLSKIEPHSPTPFLLKRAISWGRMSVVDLLQEIVRDKNDYQNILQLLGVSKNESS